MNPTEVTVGLSLALVFALVAVYYLGRQRQTGRRLHEDAGLSPEERRFLHQQRIRRLVGSALMLVLSGLLVGWFFIAPESDLRPAEAGNPTEEEKDAVRLLVIYWIVFLLVFLAFMAMAVLDFVATARFGRDQVKQLEQHRRDVLAAEAARARQRRAEMN